MGITHDFDWIHMRRLRALLLAPAAVLDVKGRALSSSREPLHHFRFFAENLECTELHDHCL